MQNFESMQPGATGKKTFGHKEENRTAGSRMRSSFGNASEKFSDFMGGGQQNLSEEYQKHAQAARNARSVLVRFLEGAMGEPPMDELLV